MINLIPGKWYVENHDKKEEPAYLVRVVNNGWCSDFISLFTGSIYVKETNSPILHSKIERPATFNEVERYINISKHRDLLSSEDIERLLHPDCFVYYHIDNQSKQRILNIIKSI